MGYKTILVHVDAGQKCPRRLALASELANSFDAHLVGLFVESDVPVPPHAAALAGSMFREKVAEIQRESINAAEKTFHAHARSSGDSPAEWRSAVGDPATLFSLHARYADLVVIGQTNAEDATREGPDFPAQVLMAAGRPVLLVPYAGRFPTVGKRVLVCWSGTRESTRAVTDALPLLKRAEHVRVATFNPERGSHGDVPGADIGLFLARHGVKIEVSEYHSRELDVGSQILSRSMDLACDLIVMGGYGHSRLRELVLGGVSRTLLESMTVPVLMAH